PGFLIGGFFSLLLLLNGVFIYGSGPIYIKAHGMGAKQRMENTQLQPSGKEFRCGIIDKASNIGSYKRVTRYTETLALFVGQLEVIPAGHIIAGPKCRITLSAGKVGAG